MFLTIGPISQREYWRIWDLVNGIKRLKPSKPRKAKPKK
jgi:hypothetical protein